MSVIGSRAAARIDGKYTETELQEYGQIKRAEGVEAGIKIGQARASNGSSNGHGYTLPKDTVMAEYCHQQLGRLKSDSERDFYQPRVPENTTKSKPVVGRAGVFGEHLHRNWREGLTDGDGAGDSTSFGRSRLCTDPGSRQSAAVRAHGKRSRTCRPQCSKAWSTKLSAREQYRHSDASTSQRLTWMSSIEPAAIAIEELVRERLRGTRLHPAAHRDGRRSAQFCFAPLTHSPRSPSTWSPPTAAPARKSNSCATASKSWSPAFIRTPASRIRGRSATRPTSRAMICPISARRRRSSWLTISSSCCAAISATAARGGARAQG